MLNNISGYSNSSYSNYSMKIPSKEDIKEPPIDSNGDEAWDVEELEQFSKELSEKVGVSFDSEAIITKYDTDGDGTITDSEKDALKTDNAFNMPSLQSIQNSMMSEMGPPKMPPMGGAKAVQGSSNSNTLDVESTSSDSDLLSALETDTTYSQDIIDKYDANGNGKIDASEKVAIEKDKAKEKLENSNILKAAIQAYSESSQYSQFKLETGFDSLVG